MSLNKLVKRITCGQDWQNQSIYTGSCCVWLVDGYVQTEVDLLKMQIKASHLPSFLFVWQKSSRWCRWLTANYRSYTSDISFIPSLHLLLPPSSHGLTSL